MHGGFSYIFILVLVCDLPALRVVSAVKWHKSWKRCVSDSTSLHRSRLLFASDFLAAVISIIDLQYVAQDLLAVYVRSIFVLSGLGL